MVSTPMKQEISPRRRKIAKACTILSVILMVLGLMRMYLSTLSPLTFDSVSVEQLDDFGDLLIDSSRSDEGSHYLTSFYPITNTPYVFCDFLPIRNEQHLKTQGHLNCLIDIKKAKRVASIRWINTYRSMDAAQSSKMLEDKGVLLSGDKPVFVFTRQERVVPHIFKKLWFIPHGLLNYGINPKKEVWTVDLQGNVNKIKNAPIMFIFDQYKYRPRDFSKLLTKCFGFSSGLYQYGIRDSKFGDVKYLNDEISVVTPTFGLPGGGYLLNQWNAKSLDIIKPALSQTISIKYQKLLPDIKPLPKNTSAIPLTFSNQNKCLFYLDMPAFPIFEIDLVELNNQTVDQSVKFLGYGKQCRLFMAFDDNQFILSRGVGRENFHKSSIISHAFSILDVNDLPQNLNFEKDRQIKQYILPEPISEISYMPIDDEHLLGYGEGTFWSIKWDGSDYQQLFPLTKKIPLVTRDFPKPPLPAGYSPYTNQKR